MKRKFTFLIAAAVMLLAMMASTATAWGQTRAEVIAYTLDGTITGGDSGYANESTITQDEISWKVTGNTTMNPWRIGGKSISSVDRPVYSTTPIADNITKIEVEHGTASGITVNSWTVIVASDANFSNVVSTLTPTFTASATTTINRPTGADWTNCYYKFVYNVTVTQTSNKFVQFVKADFYKQEGSGPVIATPTFNPAAGTYINTQSVTISCETEGSTIYYTTDGSTPDNTSSQYNGAINISATTTINAIAYVGSDASSVATATYTIVNIEHDGTEEDPYTVADAHAAIDANIGVTGVYATGIVSEIVTAYNTTYHNITFNMVDEEGDQVFLQAYRCGGDDAADVTVGDIAVVTGDLTKYGQTYEFGSGCQLVSLTHPAVTVEAPTFSPEAGTYAEAQTVTMSCTTEGAAIHYTTDGTEPDGNSTVYTTGITVSETTTFKAKAIKGSDMSSVVTATYHVNSQENPYTVTQALAFLEYPANGIYVHGIVSTAPTQAPTTNGEMTYYISVDGEAENQLEVYKGKGLEQAAFTAQDDIQVGDIVTIYGNVVIYGTSNPIKEFAQGNYLVSFYRPPVPTITLSYANPDNHPFAPDSPYEFVFTYESGGGYIDEVTYENFSGSLTAENFFIQYYNAAGENVDAPDWIVDDCEVVALDEHLYLYFGVKENEGTTARTCYFKIYAYPTATDVVYSDIVTVTQAAAPAPTITLTPVGVAYTPVDAYHIELPYESCGGNLDYVEYANFSSTLTASDFQVEYCDSNGDPIPVYPDWLNGTGVELWNEHIALYVSATANDGDQRTAYFKVWAMNGNEMVYSDIVTVNQAAYVAPPAPGSWAVTPLTSLTTGDVFVIVGTKSDGSSYAMSNDNGTGNPPTAVSVTVENGVLTGDIADNIKWNVATEAKSGYIFYPDGDNETWLYCTNANNGVRVGTNDDNKVFVMSEDGYLQNVATSRYVGIYNAQDWRCYTNTTGNIADQEFAFYKKIVDPTAPSITITPSVVNATTAETEGNLAITLENIVITETGGGMFDYTICDAEGVAVPDPSIVEAWLALDFPYENDAFSVYYVVSENTSTTARTAYFKVYGLGDDGVTEAWSNIITVNQEAAVAPTPTITVDPDMVEAPVEGLIGELTVTYQNVEQDIADIMWTDEFGAPAGDEPNWVDVDFDTDYNIIYDIDENIDDARVAYFVVYSLDSESNDIYSNVVTISQAGAVTPVGDKYVKVTSTSDLTDGQYLIVYEDDGLAFNGSLTTLDAAKNTIAVTISNNEIAVTSETAASEFTIASISEGYSIQSASGYYIGQTSDANGMKTSETEVYSNTISIDTDGNVVVLASGGPYLRYNANSGQERFRYFKSSSYTNQKAIQLYKKTVDPTAPAITLSTYSINAIAGGETINIGITVANIENFDFNNLGADFCNADGSEITSGKPDFIGFDIQEDPSSTGGYVLYCEFQPNVDPDARTAYFKVTYNVDEVASNVVTATQDGYVAPVPTITLNMYEISNVSVAGTTAYITVTCTNFTSYVDVDKLFADYCNADGSEITGDKPDFIEFEFNQQGGEITLTCTIAENEGAARTAYFHVFYDDGNKAVIATSDVVTVSQEGLDYATLPFVYTDEDVKADPNLTNMPAGLSQSGVTTYTSANATQRLKFDGTGDYLVLYLNTAPASLTYDIKGNMSGTGWTGDFRVQTSADGNEYTDLVVYTTMNTTATTITHLNLPTSTKYIKWYFASKDSGKNVGLGNIKATAQYDVYGIAQVESLSTATIPCVIYNGGKLTVTETMTSDDPDMFVIKDGGQLIHNNSGVMATVQKNIAASTTWGSSSEAVDGWYFIGSGLKDNVDYEAFASTGLLTDEYDFYAWNALVTDNKPWRNYKAGAFSSMNPYAGYLYANQNDVTLGFAGELLDSDDNVEAPLTYNTGYPFGSWTLWSNPFMCNAYITEITGEGLAFYRMKADGSDYEAATGAIKPLEGFFVQATAADQSFEFTRTAPVTAPGKGNLDIRLAQVVNSRDERQATDNAIVRFDGGSGLEKFSFREGSTKIYIPMNGTDYSVVSAQAKGVIPVNFKAETTGTYTISFSNSDVEFTYLHLIDKLAGEEVDLLLEPSYTFMGSIRDDENRFLLVFNSIDGNIDVESDIFAYQNGDEIIVSGVGELQVYDVMGRFVTSYYVNGTQTIEKPAATGVYILRMIGEDIKTQKIVVK